MVDDIVRKEGFLSLGTRLRRIGERLQADVQRVIDEFDLPILTHHYPLLYALDEYGSLEIGQLARALGVSQPGVTRSVNQLKEIGCISITQDAKDKRVRQIALNALGQEFMQIGRSKIAPRVLAGFDRIFGDQSAAMLSLLDQLENSLNEKPLGDNGQVRKGTSDD